MREKLNRLARGVISGDVPVMTLDRGQISGEVKKGEKLRAEITAGSEGTVPLKGLAYSDHPRVRGGPVSLFQSRRAAARIGA